MPPVFMHSSTMMTRLVFCTLLVMASMSKGFRLMRSITCRHIEGQQLTEADNVLWCSTCDELPHLLHLGNTLLCTTSSLRKVDRLAQVDSSTMLSVYCIDSQHPLPIVLAQVIRLQLYVSSSP